MNANLNTDSPNAVNQKSIIEEVISNLTDKIKDKTVTAHDTDSYESAVSMAAAFPGQEKILKEGDKSKPEAIDIKHVIFVKIKDTRMSEEIKTLGNTLLIPGSMPQAWKTIIYKMIEKQTIH